MMADLTRRRFFGVVGAALVGAVAFVLPKGEDEPDKSLLRAVEPEPEPSKTNSISAVYVASPFDKLRISSETQVNSLKVDGDVRFDGDLYLNGKKVVVG